MSINAVVQQVSDLLSRTHTLFAVPATSSHQTVADPGATLVDTSHTLHAVRDRTAPLSGRLAGDHGLFTGAAGAELSALAGSDQQLSRHLEHAATTQHRGSVASIAVIGAATHDTAALAPLLQTPAGQHAVVRALRARVAQQQRILTDTRDAAAAAAAAVRSLTYLPAGCDPAAGSTT